MYWLNSTFTTSAMVKWISTLLTISSSLCSLCNGNMMICVDIICSSKSITHGDRLVFVHNGVPMLQKITATGCAVTAPIAAFVAAADPLHAFDATVSALSVFGIAGEMGMELAKGPASLRMHLIDSLYGLDQPALLSHINITG